MIKHLTKEWWDDYQLQSLTMGGNQPFINLLSEVELPRETLEARHRHPLVRWHRARHIALLDGFEFKVPKPDLQ